MALGEGILKVRGFYLDPSPLSRGFLLFQPNKELRVDYWVAMGGKLDHEDSRAGLTMLAARKNGIAGVVVDASPFHVGNYRNRSGGPVTFSAYGVMFDDQFTRGREQGYTPSGWKFKFFQPSFLLNNSNILSYETTEAIKSEEFKRRLRLMGLLS